MKRNYNKDERDVESINAAKRRLLELESVEKNAREIENKVKKEEHFTDRHSIFLLIGEIVIVLGTLVEIAYYLVRDEPLGTISFLSMLTTVGIAGFLFWRLDGMRRVKSNEKKLRELREQIESEQTEAEKAID